MQTTNSGLSTRFRPSYNPEAVGIVAAHKCGTWDDFIRLYQQQQKDLNELIIAYRGLASEDLLREVHRLRNSDNLVVVFKADYAINPEFQAAAKEWAKENDLLDRDKPLPMDVPLSKFTWEGKVIDTDLFYSRRNNYPNFGQYAAKSLEELYPRPSSEKEISRPNSTDMKSLSELAGKDLAGDKDAYKIVIKREDGFPIALKEKLLYEDIDSLRVALKGMQWDEETIFTQDVGDDLLVKKRLRSIAHAKYTL
jgi:hypothetical protein